MHQQHAGHGETARIPSERKPKTMIADVEFVSFDDLGALVLEEERCAKHSFRGTLGHSCGEKLRTSVVLF